MHRFKTVSDIRIEPGGTSRLDAHVRDLPRNKRIAIVTDKGVRALGLMDAGIAALQDSGYDVMIFDEVVADPPEDVVIAGAKAVKRFDAGMVIGFGGGSPMDTAKLIAFLADNDVTLSEIYGVDVAQGSRLPLLLMPTTSGTGSEVTNVAIITAGPDSHNKGSKNAVVSDPLYADRVLLDANLTLGLPAHITAATGIDAMVHAIEAYTSVHRKNPISDAIGLSALRKLSRAIGRAVNVPDDVEARNDMLIGAMLAGQAFSNAPVGAIHGLAYPLGGFFHVPHGLSNSLVMVEVMKFNAQEDRAKQWYGEIASDLCVGTSASALIDEILRLQDETRVQRRLRDVDIAADAIPMMADDAILKDRVLRNNPRAMTRDDIVRIYETIA
ncbi:iron-containing alcohol dehydrogenase [Algimonas porphyrae]|uniref:Alcohol dehydrogenase n=1 Tax=Algimonas porphyrae TaxID=1128113 RepID=A0ABQ5V1M6_9PROT|nr:iron-containing alcohol dehydrogenase [Algimonas porphyrae]GLQ21343.1 alcohol dehydrogenase [Algimonas porphyrae]